MNSLHRIPSWEDAERGIRELLDALRYDKETVIARHYAGERTGRVLRTGTDRTQHSFIWGHEYDYHGAKPGTADTVAYAWTLNLNTSPIILDRSYGPTDFRPTLRDSEGLALYDPERLIRRSECEYHFQTHPTEALLGIIVADTTTPSDTRLGEVVRSASNIVQNAYESWRERRRQEKIRSVEANTPFARSIAAQHGIDIDDLNRTIDIDSIS
jgi:hypothetical protein